MTPLIVPGVGGDSPLFTWGDIAGTPLNLDPSQPPAWMPMSSVSERDSRFEIKPISKRESVGRDLSGNARKRHSTGSSSSQGSRDKKQRQMTPAALALAGKLAGGGPATPFGGGLVYNGSKKSGGSTPR